MNIIIVPAITFSAFITGFIIGKLHERFEWNKLIEEGLIPTPKKG